MYSVRHARTYLGGYDTTTTIAVDCGKREEQCEWLFLVVQINSSFSQNCTSISSTIARGDEGGVSATWMLDDDK